MRQISRWRKLPLALIGVAAVTASCSTTPNQADVLGPVVSVEQSARPQGVVQPSQAFAALPFAAQDAAGLKITSGWVTAQDEDKIIHSPEHHAVDFEGVKCGSPLFAPANGWAVATYQSGVEMGAADDTPPHNQIWTDPDNHVSGYLGLAGLVVEIQFDQPDMPVAGAVGGSRPTAQFMHLSAVNPQLHWIAPVQKPSVATTDGKQAAIWFPGDIAQSQADIQKIATYVHKGDWIGDIGRTGINFGQDDTFNPATHTVQVSGVPWDPQGVGVRVEPEMACQLHAFWYAGRDASHTKVGNFDPLDRYDQITGEPGTDSYHNPDNPSRGRFVVGPGTAFNQKDGHLVFAK